MAARIASWTRRGLQVGPPMDVYNSPLRIVAFFIAAIDELPQRTRESGTRRARDPRQRATVAMPSARGPCRPTALLGARPQHMSSAEAAVAAGVRVV